MHASGLSVGRPWAGHPLRARGRPVLSVRQEWIRPRNGPRANPCDGSIDPGWRSWRATSRKQAMVAGRAGTRNTGCRAIRSDTASRQKLKAGFAGTHPYLTLPKHRCKGNDLWRTNDVTISGARMRRLPNSPRALGKLVTRGHACADPTAAMNRKVQVETDLGPSLQAERLQP